MKLLLSILLIAFLSFLCGLFLPWWSIAIVAFVITMLIPQASSTGFLSGFLGIFLLWGILAFWIDIKNDGILAKKIALLFSLGAQSILIILVTAVVGALVAGFAGMAGSSLRPVNRYRKRIG